MATQVINDSILSKQGINADRISPSRYSHDPVGVSSSVAMGVARLKSGVLPMEAAIDSKVASHLPDALAVEASDEMFERLEKYHKVKKSAAEMSNTSGSTAVFSGSIANYDAARQASIALIESNGLDWKSARDQQVLRHNLTEALMREKSVKERDSAEKEKRSTLIKSGLQIAGAALTIAAAGVALKWSIPSKSNTADGKGLVGSGPKADGAYTAPTPTTSAVPAGSTVNPAVPGVPRANPNVSELGIFGIPAPTVPAGSTVNPAVPGVPRANPNVSELGIFGIPAPTGSKVSPAVPGAVSSKNGQPDVSGGAASNGNNANPSAALDKQAELMEKGAKLALMGPALGAISQLMNAVAELSSMNDRELSRLATAEATELGALSEKSRSEGEIERSHAQARVQNGFDPMAKAIEVLNQVKVDRLRAIANPSA